jgi:hypothetical protein
MELSLKDLDVAEIVRQAVAASLIQKLDRVLPKLLEDILTKEGRYGAPNIVNAAVRSAIEDELQRQLTAMLLERGEQIQTLVKQHVEQHMSPEFVAGCVLSGLAEVQIRVKPFGVKKKASVIENEES